MPCPYNRFVCHSRGSLNGNPEKRATQRIAPTIFVICNCFPKPPESQCYSTKNKKDRVGPHCKKLDRVFTESRFDKTLVFFGIRFSAKKLIAYQALEYPVAIPYSSGLRFSVLLFSLIDFLNITSQSLIHQVFDSQ